VVSDPIYRPAQLGGVHSLGTNINSPFFGQFTNPQTNLPRSIQFSLRLTY